MKKYELRKIYKDKRLELSMENRAFFDQVLNHYLMDMDWSTCSFLHVYIPIKEFNEPNIDSFFAWITKKYAHIQLVISRSDLGRMEMINYLWNDDITLVKSRWGVLEPVDGQIVAENKIDVVLVPLLAADTKGHRVGYGKGFYDKFLAKCKPEAIKIGISYFDVVEQIDDVDIWDVPLDWILTPERAIKINL